jgi:hypothetical protein
MSRRDLTGLKRDLVLAADVAVASFFVAWLIAMFTDFHAVANLLAGICVFLMCVDLAVTHARTR